MKAFWGMIFGFWILATLIGCGMVVNQRVFNPTEYGKGEQVSFDTNPDKVFTITGDSPKVQAESTEKFTLENPARQKVLNGTLPWQKAFSFRLGPEDISPGEWYFHGRSDAFFNFTSQGGSISISGYPSIGGRATWIDFVLTFTAWVVVFLIGTWALSAFYPKDKPLPQQVRECPKQEIEEPPVESKRKPRRKKQ